MRVGIEIKAFCNRPAELAVYIVTSVGVRMTERFVL
jgi:hypothetical protein